MGAAQGFPFGVTQTFQFLPAGKHLQLSTEQNMGSRLCARLNVAGPLTIREDYIIHEAAAVQRGISIKDACFLHL